MCFYVNSHREHPGVSKQNIAEMQHALVLQVHSLTGELLHASERKLTFLPSAASAHSEV